MSSRWALQIGQGGPGAPALVLPARTPYSSGQPWGLFSRVSAHLWRPPHITEHHLDLESGGRKDDSHQRDTFTAIPRLPCA